MLLAALATSSSAPLGPLAVPAASAKAPLIGEFRFPGERR